MQEEPEVTMKQNKLTFKLAAALLCLALALTACSAPAEQQSTPAPTSQPTEAPVETGVYTPGTYTGTGAGRNGELKVEVTFDAASITDIKVVSHTETQGISDLPLERIPQEIVQYQSLAVDTVATATMTSQAILEAVADAVTQAGGDAEALKAVEIARKEAGELVERTADVIVLGGGGAGVAAAHAAADNGASVIVVEKTAALGGNTMRSGGYFNAVYPKNQQVQTMTEGQLQQVEDYCTMEPKDEMMKGWQEKLSQEFEAYKATGATHLFDSIYLHLCRRRLCGQPRPHPVHVRESP